MYPKTIRHNGISYKLFNENEKINIINKQNLILDRVGYKILIKNRQVEGISIISNSNLAPFMINV